MEYIDSFDNMISDNYHLNWFGKADSEGRTEEPTERKKTKTREKGQVAKSMDLNTAVILLFCFGLLYFLVPYYFDNLSRFVRVMLRGDINYTFININNIRYLTIAGTLFIFKLTGPLLAAAFIISIVISVIQNGGFIFSTEQLKFDMKKLLPSIDKIKDKMLFSKKSGFEFFKSLVKVAIVGYLGYSILKNNYRHMLELVNGDAMPGVLFIKDLAFEIILKSLLIFFVFALIDYKFQRHEYIENIKMTKQEVKDERKQMEGDPLIKSKIREKQREIARRRMMQEVPEADVVITNPTHYSIAVKYEIATMDAPVVVAKGQGFIALKIRMIAEEHDVPIVENKPLARALYQMVEVGEEIPQELYKAMAEVLAFVWKLKRKRFETSGVGV